MPHDIGAALRAIDEVTELCLSLRRGYRRQHPDAPLSTWEREQEALLRLLDKHAAEATDKTQQQEARQ